MKLKKIASLALAGVMAVSMLAGCANKPGNNDGNQGGEVVGSTPAIVTAVNNGQDADNDVKITFTDAGDLMTALQQAVSLKGSGIVTDLTKQNKAQQAAKDLLNEVVMLTGFGGKISGTTANAEANEWKVLTDDAKEAGTESAMMLKCYKAADYANTESFVLLQAAEDVDAQLTALKADTSEGKKPGQDYFKYEYTGKVGMLTYKTVDGTTYYVVLTAVTRTATEAKMAEI